jgi:hypothetical protein
MRIKEKEIEAEKFREICHKIIYTIWVEFAEYEAYWYFENIRELIFKPDFMDKLAKYYCNEKKQMYIEWGRPMKIQNIMHHLDNPVDYIHKLIIK